MPPQSYTALLGVACRYARRRTEAEDLLQNAMLVAVQAGRADLSSVSNRRWISGVMRKMAAFDARSALRRQMREKAWLDVLEIPGPQSQAASVEEARRFALSLPPRMRTAALLAISGHTRAEIAWLLRIPDVSVRQYVTEIRRRWKAQGGAGGDELLHLAGSLAYGRIRQSLRHQIRHKPDVHFATHDPDGHTFSFRLNSQNQE